jgi:hypothetical protein
MSLIRLGVPPNVHRWELHLAGMKFSIHALLMLKSVEIATIQFCVLNKSPTPFLYRNVEGCPLIRRKAAVPARMADYIVRTARNDALC